MKYLMTTLLACTLGIGYAHAQDMGSNANAEDQSRRRGESGSNGIGAQGITDTYRGVDAKPAPKRAKTGTGTSSATPSDAWSSSVTPLSLRKGRKIEATGSLASGQPTPDLQLPATCVSLADKPKFAGNQVLFGAELPAKSNLTVTVTPRDAAKKINVFAYAMPVGRFDLPSAVSSSMRACTAASMPGWRGEAYGRRIQLRGSNEPENVVIGVAGPADMTSGDFTITVEAR